MHHRAAAHFLHVPERPKRQRQEFSAFVFGSEVSSRRNHEALTTLLATGAGSARASTNPRGSLLRLSAIGFQSQELGQLDPLEELQGSSGPWVAGPWRVLPSQALQMEGPDPDVDPLEDDLWDRGSGGSEHVDHHHQHAVEHLEHHPHEPHDDTMTDFGVALISSGTTIFLAFMSAIFAMRLFREMMRPPAQQMQGMNAGADGDAPGVLQLDIPGVQPFRPFSGQGYRLVMEPDSKASGVPSSEVTQRTRADADKEKDTPRSLSPASVVSVGAQPSTVLSPGPRQQLPQFGADEAPEVTAPP
ncbi:unnamed protein product [Symbiodinium sp. CCMP2592]|nr:unnamed protein product [Symbiodinium sp. CCMP2592]